MGYQKSCVLKVDKFLPDQHDESVGVQQFIPCIGINPLNKLSNFKQPGLVLICTYHKAQLSISSTQIYLGLKKILIYHD